MVAGLQDEIYENWRLEYRDLPALQIRMPLARFFVELQLAVFQLP